MNVIDASAPRDDRLGGPLQADHLVADRWEADRVGAFLVTGAD